MAQAAKKVLSISALTALTALLSAVAPSAGDDRDRGGNTPLTVAPRGLSEELKEAKGRVRVSILLRSQPVLEAAQRPERQRVLSGQIGGLNRVKEYASRNPRRMTRQERDFASRYEIRRNRVLRSIGQAGRKASTDQEPVLRAIERAGGTVVETGTAPNNILAFVPGRALVRLADRADVQAIGPAPKEKPLINISAYTTGADTWWAAGHTGGTGGSDLSAVDIAIKENGITETNPAFSGIDFDTPPVPDPQCLSYDHGTQVTGVVVSQDATYKGLSFGADRVLNACSFDGGQKGGTAWAMGVTQGEYPGASDPAEVMNVSAGNVATEDDSQSMQGADFHPVTFGISYVAAAGNEGPAQTVNSPSTAYNPISVAASNDKGTDDGHADDIITSYSSRGPTPGGRKKPDIAAMGGGGGYRGLTLPDGDWPGSGQVFESGLTGTSFSTPHVSAAAMLLAGAGVTDSKARKAILINSTYPYESQTGWRADSGWGILDLDRAIVERDRYESGDVVAEGARFFGAAVAAGDRATLTWYRRTYYPNYPYLGGEIIYTFTDLDLYQFAVPGEMDPAPGVADVASESTIDSVEQVRSPSTGQIVYKVKAASTEIDGADSEAFAIAATKPLAALDTPTLAQTPNLGASQVKQGQNVTLQVQIQNTGDLKESGAQATLTPPTGVEVTGSNPQPIGDGVLNPDDTETVAWTIRGTQDGTYNLPIGAQASGWGETFTSQSLPQIKVDSTAPTVSVRSLPTYTTSSSIGVSWVGSDGQGVGVQGYDVEVSDNGGPWTRLVTGITATSLTHTGQEGHTYGFRARATDSLGNAGGFPGSAQAQTTVDTQAPSLSLTAPGSVSEGEDVAVGVSTSDVGSGIASLGWQLFGSLPVEILGSSFVIPASMLSVGANTVSVTATDAVGHSTTKQVSIQVEKQSSHTTRKRSPRLKLRRTTVNKKRSDSGRRYVITIKGKIRKSATGRVRIAKVKRLKSSRRRGVRSSTAEPGALARTSRVYRLSGKRSYWTVRVRVKRRGRYRLSITYSGDGSYQSGRLNKRVTVR